MLTSCNCLISYVSFLPFQFIFYLFRSEFLEFWVCLVSLGFFTRALCYLRPDQVEMSCFDLIWGGSKGDLLVRQNYFDISWWFCPLPDPPFLSWAPCLVLASLGLPTCLKGSSKTSQSFSLFLLQYEKRRWIWLFGLVYWTKVPKLIFQETVEVLGNSVILWLSAGPLYGSKGGVYFSWLLWAIMLYCFAGSLEK